MSRSGHYCRLLLKNNNLCEKNVRDLYLLVNECSLLYFILAWGQACVGLEDTEERRLIGEA